MSSLALLLCLAPMAQDAAAPPAPEVVVFVLDDISTFDLAGLPLPNLKGLAARGVLFERAYGAPVCHPARRTMLSGEVWTHKDGSIPCEPHNGEPPPLGALPLAQLFADAGYLTMGFGKWHLGEDPLAGPWEYAPFSHGFEHWFAGLGANVERCGGRHYRLWQRFEEGTSGFVHSYQTLDVLDSFATLYPPQRGPRFAWVALQAAHEPFHRPPDRLLPPGYPDTPDARAQYESMIVSADVALGEMLAVLDLDRTLVVVVADNGTPPDVAPDRDKAKTTTFERGVRVPMVIAGPGVVPGTVRTPVHIADLFETLRERCGLDRTHAVRDAVSLVPCLTDAHHQPRQHVFVGLDDDLAVVTQRFKLREKAGVEAFYDLALDPREEAPLPLDAPRYRPIIAALRRLLAAERR
jgi:arylsulfatase A-like enzyme